MEALAQQNQIRIGAFDLLCQPCDGLTQAEGGEHLHAGAEGEQVSVQLPILGEYGADQQGAVALLRNAGAGKFVKDPVGHVGGKLQYGLHPEQGRNIAGGVNVRGGQLPAEHILRDGQGEDTGQAENAVILFVCVIAL